jgi:hypothetical protein
MSSFAALATIFHEQNKSTSSKPAPAVATTSAGCSLWQPSLIAPPAPKKVELPSYPVCR